MANSSPDELPSRDPAGFRWELQEDTRRELMAHLSADPMFTAVAVDEFIWRVNTRVRFYRKHRKDALPFDPKRLTRFATHASALADAIKEIDSGNSLFNRRVDLQDRARVVLPEPSELRRIADVARELRKHFVTHIGKGKQYEVERLHRHFLIRDLWQNYPEQLRSKALRSHFIETLRIILRRSADDESRRALQAEARIALAGIK
jgi:hypothetical protein